MSQTHSFLYAKKKISDTILKRKEIFMVEKIFWKDPYLTQLNTTVTSVNGCDITVKETIFYAFSGGQESDQGYINGYPVLDAKKDKHEIIYTLDENHGLQVNDEILITINWERRYKLMKLHFAAEIILELVYQYCENIQKIGAHISEDKARIDFIWDENISKIFSYLEKEAYRLIQEEHEILSDFSDSIEEKRYWEIKGFSKVSCGGTHIKNTKEIGCIKLKRVNIGKGKERIEIYLIENIGMNI